MAKTTDERNGAGFISCISLNRLLIGIYKSFFDEENQFSRLKNLWVWQNDTYALKWFRIVYYVART